MMGGGGGEVGTKWRKYMKTCMFNFVVSCIKRMFAPFSAHFFPHDIIAERVHYALLL